MSADMLGLDDPDLPDLASSELVDELRGLVRAHARGSARSQQTLPGPSEIGHPCARKLAFKLAGADRVNPDGDPWPAYVGTSVHAQLALAAEADNTRLGRQRWLIEAPVPVYGDIRGTVDLYDTDHGRVIDHKVLGNDSLNRLKRSGPSLTYRTQVALYAFGLAQLGHDVQTIAIAAWPRSGQLRGLHIWSQPYTPQLVDELVEPVLRRVDLVRAALDAGVLVDLIPNTPEDCLYCPWFTPRAVTTPGTACAGDTQHTN